MEVFEAIIARQDVDKGITLADEALEIPTTKSRSPSPGAGVQGLRRFRQGDWKEGLALIDEATSVALSGDAGLRSASDVYCVTIFALPRRRWRFPACRGMTEEADRWMNRHSVAVGVCHVRRAELKRLRGDWTEAEQDAEQYQLERYHMLDGVGHGQYEVGEIRLHMGDLAGAEAAFNMAYEHGAVPRARSRPREAGQRRGRRSGTRPSVDP